LSFAAAMVRATSAASVSVPACALQGMREYDDAQRNKRNWVP
jgi:hypothetical protein